MNRKQRKLEYIRNKNSLRYFSKWAKAWQKEHGPFTMERKFITKEQAMEIFP